MAQRARIFKVNLKVHTEYLKLLSEISGYVHDFYNLFSVNPQPCGTKCRCHFIQDTGNMFDCSSRKLDQFPPSTAIPDKTDFLDFSENNIGSMCGNHAYIKNMSGLNLRGNQIKYICADVTTYILESRSIKLLDLSRNNLTKLPKKIIKATSLVYLRLSNNPFECGCDTLWLKDWITNNSGRRTVIRDFKEVKCQDGNLLYRLDPVKMGCFPKELTVWEEILTGSSAFVILGVAVAIILISRRWKEVKWFMYLHFDVLDKNDEDEDLEIVEADALLSYRYKYICFNFL